MEEASGAISARPLGDLFKQPLIGLPKKTNAKIMAEITIRSQRRMLTFNFPFGDSGRPVSRSSGSRTFAAAGRMSPLSRSHILGGRMGEGLLFSGGFIFVGHAGLSFEKPGLRKPRPCRNYSVGFSGCGGRSWTPASGVGTIIGFSWLLGMASSAGAGRSTVSMRAVILPPTVL